jgi:8-hydroxy-5-deazaflavin:NADPH oxidoreductase
MKIGIIGSGVVGQTLGAGFLKHGHDVTIGTRDPAKLAEWKGKNPKGRVAGVPETAEFGEVIVLAVKGTAAANALKEAGTTNLSGKIVIDTNNPIADAAPVNGVLRFFTNLEESLMEALQKAHPLAKFVKAFSCVGSALMVNPQLKGGVPTMFICGNDGGAKKTVTGLLAQFGWETEDMGAVEAARAIEPLCMLWCIPGFRDNQWMHAFKLIR